MEAIFAKLKPETIKPRMKFDSLDDAEDMDEEEHFNTQEEEEEIDEFNEDDINEDNYRTTFEIEADPDEEAEELSEFCNEE